MTNRGRKEAASQQKGLVMTNNNTNNAVAEQGPIASRIIQGDCLVVLPTLASASVDAVITDPPYLGRYRDRTGRTLANDDKPAPYAIDVAGLVDYAAVLIDDLTAHAEITPQRLQPRLVVVRPE